MLPELIRRFVRFKFAIPSRVIAWLTLALLPVNRLVAALKLIPLLAKLIACATVTASEGLGAINKPVRLRPLALLNKTASAMDKCSLGLLITDAPTKVTPDAMYAFTSVNEIGPVTLALIK